MKEKNIKTHTRSISPYWGFAGILGFLGFTGLIPTIFDLLKIVPVPTFFFFFGFFGFFGFYFEGKMSGTLIDERFEANAHRAAAQANKIALSLIIGAAVFTISIVKIADTYTMLSILIAVIGFAMGLSAFLEQYLLYRFENEA